MESVDIRFFNLLKDKIEIKKHWSMERRLKGENNNLSEEDILQLVLEDMGEIKRWLENESNN